MSPRASHIDSLTPLRGVAALLVVAYHFDSLCGFAKIGPIFPHTGLLSRGYLWVDFFFVLSGFVITHVYGSRFTDPPIARGTIRSYALARFSRLYPLHFVALTLTVLTHLATRNLVPAPDPADSAGAAMMAGMYDFKSLPLHYLLLISFGLTPMSWNVPAWSIGAEWWTYFLTLPFFRFLNRGHLGWAAALPVACAAGLWLLVSRHATHTLNITFDWGIVRCLLGFLVGVCLYQFYRARVGMRFFASDIALVLSLLAGALVLHFPVPLDPPVVAPEGFPLPPPSTPLFDAVSPLVFAFGILCAACNDGIGHRLLNTRPMVWLGNVSYSVYLMQGNVFPVIFVAAAGWTKSHPDTPMPLGPKLGLLVAMLGMDLLLAAASYRWVEVPARRWLRRRFGVSSASS